jgi:hypothetical protein
VRRHTTLPDKRAKLIRLAGTRARPSPSTRERLPRRDDPRRIPVPADKVPSQSRGHHPSVLGRPRPASPQPTRADCPRPTRSTNPPRHPQGGRGHETRGHRTGRRTASQVASSRTSSTTPHEDDPLGRRIVPVEAALASSQPLTARRWDTARSPEPRQRPGSGSCRSTVQGAPRRTALLRRLRVERRANGDASSVMAIEGPVLHVLDSVEASVGWINECGEATYRSRAWSGVTRPRKCVGLGSRTSIWRSDR